MPTISAHRIDECKRFLSDLQRLHLHDARMIDLQQSARLKIARERKGYGSAMKAAKAMGVPYGTYSGHENGSRGIKHEDLVRYSRFYRVPIEWLAYGGKNYVLETSNIPVLGVVGLGEKVRFNDEGDLSLGIVELPFSLPPGCFALEARGNSQYPRVKDGELIITKWHDGNIRELVGFEAVVQTKDDEFLLKTIRNNDGRMMYNLESHNAPLMENIELKRAGRVMMILPSRSWLRAEF